MRDSLLRVTGLRALSFSMLLVSSPLVQGGPAEGWSNGPDLPTELIRSTGVYFPANGRFYAMGGRMSNTTGGDMTTPYEYNPKTNTWAYKTAPFPDNQVSQMACGVLTAGGTPYIYCAGGISASGTTTATKRVFRYDPISDTIETVGIDPWNEKAPDTLPGGFAVVENKLYILGGLTLGNGATDRIFEFTPEKAIGSQWVQKTATLPVALSFVPTTAIENLIFTAGGATSESCRFTETSNAYAYDPAKDSISPIPNIPKATFETQAVTVADEMWVLGGGRAAPGPLAEVSIYSPLTGQWRAGLPMVTGRRNFAAASDGDSVLVAGGFSGTVLKTTQMYVPETSR